MTPARGSAPLTQSDDLERINVMTTMLPSAAATRFTAAIAAWNSGDLDGTLSLYADDIRLHGYSRSRWTRPRSPPLSRGLR